MSSDQLHEQVAQIIHVFKGVNVSRYTTVVGYVLLMYDWLLTLDDEVALIWPARMSLVKVLYFVNRLSAPVFMMPILYQLAGYRPPLSDTYCKLSITISGAAQYIFTVCGTLLLTLRVNALWAQSRRLMTAVWTIFVLTYIFILVLLILITKASTPGLKYSPLFNLCVTGGTSSLTGWVFVPQAAYDTFVFVLTLIKAMEHARSTHSLKDARLFYTLYRDGVGYFLVIAALEIWNTLNTVIRPLLLLRSYYLMWAVIGVLTSRLVLNLRLAALGGPEYVTGQQSQATAAVVSGASPPQWSRRGEQPERITFGHLSNKRYTAELSTKEFGRVWEEDMLPLDGYELQERKSDP